MNQLKVPTSVYIAIVAIFCITAFAGYYLNTPHESIPESAVAVPKIKIGTTHYGIYKDTGSSQEHGDSPVIRMSDNIYYPVSNKEQDNKDSLMISATEDARRPSEEPINIKISGGDIERESTGDTITLYNQDFPIGETKLTVTASNSFGETSKVITVNKVNTATFCQENLENYGEDFGSLVDSIKSYCSAWKSQNDLNSKPTSSGSSSSSSKPSNSSSSTSSSTTCYHYEAGRCWDDLENDAYSQGRYDKYYGSYGGSYYEDDDCDSICQDILEDAYYEGYYDY